MSSRQITHTHPHPLPLQAQIPVEKGAHPAFHIIYIYIVKLANSAHESSCRILGSILQWSCQRVRNHVVAVSNTAGLEPRTCERKSAPAEGFRS